MNADCLEWMGMFDLASCVGMGRVSPVFDASQWMIFVLASLALVAVPGPAVIFITTRSVSNGRGSGLVTAAGVALGNLIHAIGAAFGVSAVIASTDGALTVIRYLGAAYLIYLGVSDLLKKRKPVARAKIEMSRRPDFGKGVLVALMNPKVILFLLAFLPQFVDAAKGPVSAQLLVLGVSFAVIGWLGDSTWALLFGSLSNRLQKRRQSRLIVILPAAIYIALGMATAIST